MDLTAYARGDSLFKDTYEKQIQFLMTMRRHTLVIDARILGSSGIGVYLKEVLPFILDCGRFQVSLLYHREDRQSLIWDDVEYLSCEAPIYSIREQFEVAWKVPSCDIFWSPHYNIPLLPIRARARVVTIHDVYHLAFRHTLRRLERWYARIVLPAAIRLSRQVITVSDFSKSEIMRYMHVDPRKLTVIHNGVAAERFRKTPTDRDRRAGPPDYCLFVGNVKPHKNITGLVEAMVHVRQACPDMNLVVVGKKEQFLTGVPRLEERIVELGLSDHVRFTGYVSDVALSDYYAGACMLVFPSFYEGFGLPPLEAMAAGIPVVASRAASIPEICGDAAWYVDPHDPYAIAQGILRVRQDTALAKKLVLKGRARVEAFSWQASARRHMDLFEDLAGHLAETGTR